MHEMRNIKGKFMLTFSILDAVFPDRYPKAKCPTAYIVVPSKLGVQDLGWQSQYYSCYLMLRICRTYGEFVKSI